MGRGDVQPYLERLQELPFVRQARLVRVAGTQAMGTDGVVEIRTPSGVTRAPCEVKRAHLSREAAERLVHRASELPGFLVFAPAVGRETGDLFERGNVNFVDLAGNCYLRIGERYVARRQGNRLPRIAPVDKGLRAPSYRVLFALLAEPRLLDVPARTLAHEAGGVSPQTANSLRARLMEQGLVLSTRRCRRWGPLQWRRGLDLWLAGFTTTLFPSLVLGRFRAREREIPRLEERLASGLTSLGDWRWGGGAASQRLTGYYRGERTMAYLGERRSDIARRLALVPDPSGPVCIAQAPGPIALEGPQSDCVHPLLAYTDLLAEGHDRAREAAGEVFRRYLATSEEEA